MKPKFNECAQLLRRGEWCEEAVQDRLLPDDPQQRKAIPVYSAFMRFFPRAIVAVTKMSMEGQAQHNADGDSIKWIRSASSDDKDALMRHVLEEDWAKVAWRAMAILEKHLEEVTL